MAAEWAFLEPWHAVLRDSIIPGGVRWYGIWYASVVQLATPPRHIIQSASTLRLHLEDVNLPLKQIQEAMELFTMLSLVNNRAFEELFRRPGRSGCFSFNYYPMWNVYLCGTLPYHGPAVVQPPGTWSSLCGFHGGRRYEEKSEFQVAMQRLKEMRMEEGRNDYRTEINWVCKFQGARVIGAVRADEFVDTWNGFQTNLQRLFDTGVPPIVQLCLARDRAKLLDTWQQTCLADTSTQSATKHVYVTIQDLMRLTYSQDLGLGLIRTPTKSLRLIFDEEPCKSRDADPIQTITNLESLLSVVVCGRSICEATALASGVNYCELKIATMRVSKAVFAAICSAIAAKSDPIPLYLSIDSIDAGSWSWLAIVEFCGMSVIPSLTIWKAALTKFDTSSIAAVLRCYYPQPGLRSGSIAHCHLSMILLIFRKGLKYGSRVSMLMALSLSCC